MLFLSRVSLSHTHSRTCCAQDALKHGYYLGFAVVGVSLLAIGVHQAAKCAGKTAGLTFCGVAFVVNGMSNWVFFVHVSSVVYTAGAQLLTRNPLWVVVSCFIALAVAIVAYAYRWRIYFVFAFFSVQTTYFGVVAVRYQRDQRSDLTQLGTTDWRWMAIAGAVLLLRVLYVWACNDTVERYLNSHCCCCCREGRHSDRNRTHGRASASGAKSNAKYAVVPEIEMY